MPRALVTAVALAAVGVGVWLLVRDRSDPPGDRSPDATATGASGASPSAAPALAASGTKSAQGKSARGRVVGRVLSGDKPVAAAIELRQGDATVNASAGADGAFTIDGVGTGTWNARATTGDGRAGFAWARLPVDGLVVHVRVAVVKPSNVHTLAGRVLHADGRRWEGDVVVGDEAPVKTDAEGRFAVTGLEPGDATVVATNGDALRVEGPPAQLPSVREYVLIVDEHVRTLRGRVVAAEDGKPIAGATVATDASLPGDGRLRASVSTADDGAFAIATEDGGSCGIEVSAPGRCSVERRVEAAEDDLRFALPRVARVHGLVVSERGPVAGAVVHLSGWARVAGPVGFSTAGAVITTDERGAFEADVAPGEVRAWAFGPEWESESVASILDTGRFPTIERGTGASASTRATLRAIASPWMEGRVVDADGKPVVGALVSAALSDVAHERRNLIATFAPAATASDADGTFRLTPLVPGRAYTLTVETGRVADLHVLGLRAPAAGALTVEARLPTARSRRIVVQDKATGSPIAGASVTCSWSPDAAETPAEGWALADEQGVAVLDALPAPGNWCSIGAEAPGYVKGYAEKDAGATEAVVSLSRVGSEGIEGRVVLEGADVGPLAVAGVLIEAGRKHALTDSEGRWRIDGVDDEEYINAERRWRGAVYHAEIKAKPGERDIVLRLAKMEADPTAGRVLVRVLDDAGKPVPWASVKWSNDDYPQPASNGRAFIRAAFSRSNKPNQPPITLSVFDARGDDGEPLALGAAEGVVVAEDAKDIEVRLPRALAIEGRVTTGDGRGVAGVRIRAAKSFDSYDAGSTAFAQTDATGAFAVKRLGPGEYVLLVEPPSGFVAPPPFRATSGVTDVVVRLRASVSARVRVVDEKGAPLPGTRVRLNEWQDEKAPRRPHREENSKWFNPAITDRDGVAVLAGLDRDASFDLRVEHPSSDRVEGVTLGREITAEERNAALPIFVFRGWKPADLEVRLVKSDVVRGKVIDTHGLPISEACVWARVESTQWTSVYAGKDGTFTLPLLPPGDVTLRAALSHGAAASTTDTIAKPGRGDVVLTLDTGPEIAVRIDGWPGDGYSALLFRVPAQPIANGQRCLVATVGRDGRVRFPGLDAKARYALWIAPMEDGHSLLAKDLAPASGERVLRLMDGKPVVGSIVAPPNATDVRASLIEVDLSDERVDLDVGDDRRFESSPVPPGRWVVRAWAGLGGKELTGEAPATPGTTVEVVLREEK